MLLRVHFFSLRCQHIRQIHIPLNLQIYTPQMYIVCVCARVSNSVVCAHLVTAVEVLNGVTWSEALDDAFKLCFQRDADIGWQYFCSYTGFLRHFPGFRFCDTRNFVNPLTDAQRSDSVAVFKFFLRFRGRT